MTQKWVIFHFCCIKLLAECHFTIQENNFYRLCLMFRTFVYVIDISKLKMLPWIKYIIKSGSRVYGERSSSWITGLPLCADRIFFKFGSFLALLQNIEFTFRVTHVVSRVTSLLHLLVLSKKSTSREDLKLLSIRLETHRLLSMVFGI